MKGYKAIIGDYRGDFSSYIYHLSLSRKRVEEWIERTRNEMIKTIYISEIEETIIGPFPTKILEIELDKCPNGRLVEKEKGCEECRPCPLLSGFAYLEPSKFEISR